MHVDPATPGQSARRQATRAGPAGRAGPARVPNGLESLTGEITKTGGGNHADQNRADVDQQIAAWQAQQTGPAVPVAALLCDRQVSPAGRLALRYQDAADTKRPIVPAVPLCIKVLDAR